MYTVVRYEQNEIVEEDVKDLKDLHDFDNILGIFEGPRLILSLEDKKVS